MAEFANQTITIAGRKLIADSIAQKKPVTFTRIEIGDGSPPTDPETLTAPVHKIFELPVTTVRSVPDYPGLWLVTASFVAREEKGDFYFREAAIYGKFDTEGGEILVAYLNSEDTADFVKAVSAKSQMQVDLTFAIVLGNASVLTVTNPAGLLTAQDFADLEKEVKEELEQQEKDIQNFKDSTLADLQNAKNNLDNATKKFVLKSGDTMTGALNIPSHTLNAKDVKATASVTAATATLSGALNAASATLSGALNAATATLSGALNAASAKLTGDLTLRNGTASGDLKAVNFRGNLIGGTVTGSTATFSGLITGNLKGNVTGNVTGSLKGNVTGDVTGNLHGNLIGGTVTGSTATFSGLITGNLKGNVQGNLTGNVQGNLTGNVQGNLTGNVTGGTLTATTGKFSGDVTAPNFRGNLIGGTVSATTGKFSGDVTAPTFKGNLSGTSAWLTGDVTAKNFNGTLIGKWQTLSAYISGTTLPGTPNLNTATIPQLANAINPPGICYHTFVNSSNPNLPEKNGILELRRIVAGYTAALYTASTGTTYTGCVNASNFSGWQNTNNTSSVPPGSIIAFASATPPAGWLLCDGRTLSTTAYAALYAAIGHTWGGSGTNFKLPDARGQFLRGHDNGRNLDKSRAFGSSQTSGAPNITGSFYAHDLVIIDTGAFFTTSAVEKSGNGGPGNYWYRNHQFDASRISPCYRGVDEVRPTNIAVAYVIKY